MSSGSSSPTKKQFPNGFFDEYRSSPETISLPSPNSSFYAPSIAPNGNDQLLKQQYANSDYEKSATITTQTSSIRQPQQQHIENQSQKDATAVSQPHVANQELINNCQNGVSNTNGKRQPRTSEDFYLFCQFILEYENYDEMNHQEVNKENSTF